MDWLMSQFWTAVDTNEDGLDDHEDARLRDSTAGSAGEAAEAHADLEYPPRPQRVVEDVEQCASSALGNRSDSEDDKAEWKRMPIGRPSTLTRLGESVRRAIRAIKNNTPNRWEWAVSLLIVAVTLLGLAALRSLRSVEVENSEAPQFDGCTECTPQDELRFSGGQLWSDEAPSCELVKRSLLHRKECGETGTGKAYPLLVAGVGHSGMDYLQSALSRHGVHLARETAHSPSEDGTFCWAQAFSSEPFPDKTNGMSRKCNIPIRWSSHARRFKHAVHVVREPLANIAARLGKGDFTINGADYLAHSRCNANLARDLDPALPEIELKLVLTMRHWVFMNSFEETIAEWGFRVEDFVQSPAKFARKIAALGKLTHVPTADGASSGPLPEPESEAVMKPPPAVSWSRLVALDEEFASIAQTMALWYGYPIRVGDLSTTMRKLYCQFDNLGEQTCSVAKLLRHQCWTRPDGLWDCRLGSSE